MMYLLVVRSQGGFRISLSTAMMAKTVQLLWPMAGTISHATNTVLIQIQSVNGLKMMVTGRMGEISKKKEDSLE